MRTTTRTLALAGAAGVLSTPVAIAAGADPALPPTEPGHLRAGLGDHPTVRAQMRSERHDKLLRRHRRLARAAGEHHVDARFWSNARLNEDIGRLRAKLRDARAASTTSAVGGAGASPQLESIAACESGGNPHAVGGGGTFRGKYQFTYASWAAVGGHGDPAAAPEAEQDRRAAMLMARSGTGNWPVCG